MTPAERARLIDEEEFRRESEQLRAKAFARLEAARAADFARFDPIRNPDQQHCKAEDLINYNGETKTAASWANSLGLSCHTFLRRCAQHGRIEAVAMGKLHTTPGRNSTAFVPKGRAPREFTINGVTRTLNQWAAVSGINPATLRTRITRGLTMEAALRLDTEGTRSAKRYTHNGKSQTVQEWADELGLSVSRLYVRLRKYPLERALNPHGQYKRKPKVRKEAQEPKSPTAPKTPRAPKGITINGVTLTLKDWAKRLSVAPSTLYTRVAAGMTKEEAILSFLDGDGYSQKQHVNLITINGRALSLRAWAREARVSPAIICRRVRMGMTKEEAVRFYLDGNGRFAHRTPRGVASDFEGSKGTGGGRHLQETTEITFSNKDEDR